MMSRRHLRVLAALLGAVLGAGFAGGDVLRTFVSIPPQAWLVEQIGGERVVVEVLLAPGESPATFQPSDAQVSRLMQARLCFSIGVPFEQGPWFEAVQSHRRFRMVDQGAGLKRSDDDPHIWLSPRRLVPQAATIAEALGEMDPDGREYFDERRARLEARLLELDATLQERLRPWEGRVFVVFHPSWSYFAADYGLVQMAIEHGGREPSDAELTALIGRARSQRVATVFVSPQIHGQGARAVAKGLGARVETLDPLAADIVANLLETADKLVASFVRESGGG